MQISEYVSIYLSNTYFQIDTSYNLCISGQQWICICSVWLTLWCRAIYYTSPRRSLKTTSRKSYGLITTHHSQWSRILLLKTQFSPGFQETNVTFPTNKVDNQRMVSLLLKNNHLTHCILFFCISYSQSWCLRQHLEIFIVSILSLSLSAIT